VSESLRRFEERLGYRFSEPSRLEAALTHRSHAYESGKGEDYERLEFLGDAVLGLVAAQWLFARDAGHSEGELSRRKSVLVSAHELAIAAEALGLGEILRLGVAEERTGGRSKASLLADSLEAVFGAVFLDGGLAAARSVVEPILEASLARVPAPGVDAKTELQEWAQASGAELPTYAVVGSEGPDHAPRFTVEVRLAGDLAGIGSGRSKKQAEQNAAAAALAARVRRGD
jgi:ribonuclease-3